VNGVINETTPQAIMIALEQTGEVTPAMQEALQIAQKVAEILPRIAIPLENLKHAFREGRLKCLTPEAAPRQIADTVARGNVQTWLQEGQTIFKGTFTFKDLPYYFTGRIDPQGLYEVNDIVQGISKRGQ
jgi:hypothetical protein